MKSTQKNEMYMAKARNLRLGPNATYIPPACVGGFALGDAKVPNANGFASQWNIGVRLVTWSKMTTDVRCTFIIHVVQLPTAGSCVCIMCGHLEDNPNHLTSQ